MPNETLHIHPEYLGLLVTCPYCPPEAPNPEHSRPLGVFLETELGRQVLTPLVEQAEQLRAEGTALETAVDTAFGNRIVRDDEANIVSITPKELKTAQADFNIEEILIDHPEYTAEGSVISPVGSLETSNENSDQEGPGPGAGPEDLAPKQAEGEDKTSEHVAMRLKDIRKQRGLSHKMLAEKAGLRADYYQKVERGDLEPSLEEYQKIIEALEAKSSDVFPF